MRGSDSRASIGSYLRQNVLALVALFFAVSSGTAMALDSKNTVFSDDIVNGEVHTGDLGQAAVTAGKLGPSTVNSVKVIDDSLRSEDILDGTLGGNDVADGGLTGNDVSDDTITGSDVSEPSLDLVPLAANAQRSGGTGGLEEQYIHIRTNSVTVPGGSQDDSNGNGVSRAVTASCLSSEVALGGGAHWSGNANSNSNELENRIHSLTYLNATGQPAVTDEIPRGIRVRGEVDKDGDDTLTVQVLCFPAV